MADDTTQVLWQLYADGRVIACDEQWTLEHMQAFVGGYIEIIPSRIRRGALVINEEGMLDDLPLNAEATRLAGADVLMLDGIRGNALLIRDEPS